MKKIVYIFSFILCVLFFAENVNAKSNVYVNSNGVEININDYDNLCEIYTKEYIEFVSQDVYESIKDYNTNDVVIKQNYDNVIIPLAAEHTTTYKSIKLIKNGTHITLQLTWLKMPTTRSYDVFGIRFSGAKLDGNITFKQIYKVNGSTKTSTSNNQQSFSNGYGTSFLIPSDSITYLQASLDFNYSGSGKIFGTYQHAQKKVTLANSKKYTISSSGYGSVLYFDSSVKESYDAMGGVNLDV